MKTGHFEGDQWAITPEVMEHLIQGCKDCVGALGESLKKIELGLMGNSTESPKYEEAMARGFKSALREAKTMVRQDDRIQEVIAGLGELDSEGRQEFITQNASLLNPHFVESLRKEGWALRFTDVDLYLSHVELAVEVASLLSPELFPKNTVYDCRGRAWAYFANALRIVSRYQESSSALRKCRYFLRKGSRERRYRAEYLRFKASLERQSLRFSKALRLYTAARNIFEMIGDTAQVANCSLSMGVLFNEMTDYTAALEHLDSAERLFELQENLGHANLCKHNRVISYFELGQLGNALDLLSEVKSAYIKTRQKLSLLRITAVEGNILQSMERSLEAERLLKSVQDGFVDANIPYDAAYVTLDLARIYAEQGRWTDLRVAAQQMLMVFKTQQAPAEAIAAFQLLVHGANMEQINLRTLQLTEKTLDRLQKQFN